MAPTHSPNGRSIDLWIPHLPPTENHIRVHRWQGGQVYTKEARDYERVFVDWMRKYHLVAISNFVSGHTETSIYSLKMVFTFETVINKGWFKKRAKTLYKRFDVGNRRKLIEDCLVSVLGDIDDCLFFNVTLVKKMGEQTGVLLSLEEVSPSEYGVPDAL